MEETRIADICIIGLGLIGASFAAACREAHGDSMRIFGCDTDTEAQSLCKAKGWCDDSFGPDEDAFSEALTHSQLVLLATPAQATLHYLNVLASQSFCGIVTDTASTKSSVCAHADEVLDNPALFVPGHPMAGSESSGAAAARADLFEGCHWILCPDARTDEAAFTSLHELLTSLKARVVSLPREEHDSALAIVSHVPHIIASSLVELAVRHADEQETLFRLAAGGFKDSTRIAAGSPDLWTGISFDNREALISGLSEIQQIISGFKDALDAQDPSTFRSLLSAAADARRALPAKWVPATENLLEVRIPMENRSGVVAEVTTIASKAGCNIHSVGIDHITANSAVLSMILTDEGDVGRLSTDLVKAGYAVSLAPLSAKE